MIDFPVTATSKTIHTSPTVLLEPENVGVAVGIPLLATKIKICHPSYRYFRYHVHYVDFRLNMVGFFAGCDIVSGVGTFSVLEN